MNAKVFGHLRDRNPGPTIPRALTTSSRNSFGNIFGIMTSFQTSQYPATLSVTNPYSRPDQSRSSFLVAFVLTL